MAAKKRGFSTFAIQHGGWCASTKYAFRTYGKYGKSNRCRNGKGGPWANDVYVLRGQFGLTTFSRSVRVNKPIDVQCLLVPEVCASTGRGFHQEGRGGYGEMREKEIRDKVEPIKYKIHRTYRTLCMTKMTKKPYPLGPHIPIEPM